MGCQEIHLTNREDEWFALKRNGAEISKYNRDNTERGTNAWTFETA